MQENHSEIIDYPIDINKFPNAKNYKFIEIELKKNECLLIPSLWVHWVFTDPYSYALSFKLINCYKKGLNNDDDLYKHLKEYKPFKFNGKKYDFNMENFLRKTINTQFRVLFSETNDLSPVIKNNSIKYHKNLTIKESLEETNTDADILYDSFEVYKDLAQDELDNLLATRSIPVTSLTKLAIPAPERAEGASSLP